MTNVVYTVPNILCGHCVRTIQIALASIAGVLSVKADEMTKIVEVSFNAPASEEIVKEMLAEIDYPVEG